jgi:protein tyrosine phosphatase (PTP) superfamily phosphohydrolase (DUF442 family)
MPVRFDCQNCGEPWWAPPANGCPRCGYLARATPDPIIWTCGQVAGTRIWITGQMRTPPRFDGFVLRGFDTFVDVAGDAHYVWRPDERAVEAVGVRYVRIPVEDTNVDLPDEAFEAVCGALDSAEGDTVLFCAAGLKRAPHLLYGVLRKRGNTEDEAWSVIQAARPMTDRFRPYIDAAERWAAIGRRRSRSR